MSLYRNTGRLFKSRLGYSGAVFKELKQVDLRPVQRVVFKFDPFHPNVREFRELIFHMSSSKLRDTNNKCIYKTDVVCDLSEPELLCKLENGTQLLFKSTNLSILEILQQLNKILTPLLPAETKEVAAVQTKSQKKR